MPKAIKKPVRNFVRETLEERTRFAQQQGLLKGKTRVLRGRIPEPLIKAAKENTGIESDTELIKQAIATMAVEDDYAKWLWSQRGTIPRDIDLEF